MTHKFLIISIVASLVIGITACQKVEKTTQVGISQEDIELSNKIISFIDKMNNPSNLKSGGIMEIDSALWNLEAAINYMYANIPDQYEFITIDSSAATITLQVNSGICSETEISNIFEQLQNELESYLISHVDAKLIAAALKTTSDSPTGDVRLTLQYLLANAPIIFEPSIAQPSLVPFTNGWYPVFSYLCGGGMCASSNPGHTHTDNCNDLATKIQEKINTYYQQLHQEVEYWTDIEIKGIHNGNYEDFYNPNDNNDCDNYRDYLIYISKFRCCSHCMGNPSAPCTWGGCLPKEECNFYLQSTFDVLSRKNAPNVPGICPVGKRVIQVTDAYGDIVPAEDNAFYFHSFTIKYGIPHQRLKECTDYPRDPK